MTKFLITATDTLTGKTVYARRNPHFDDHTVRFMRSGAYMVERAPGQDNPFAYYSPAEATRFTAAEAAERFIRLASDRADPDLGQRYWVQNIAIITAPECLAQTAAQAA